MNGKQFVSATLFSMVLLIVAFIPMASQEASPYDAWYDINEDGRIDIKDFALMAKAYGTLGDPTKNVTITGHASRAIIAAKTVSVGSGSYWTSDFITVDGYSKVSISIYFQSNLNRYYLYGADLALSQILTVDAVIDFSYSFMRTYDVMNQVVRVAIYNAAGVSCTLSVSIYLMA